MMLKTVVGNCELILYLNVVFTFVWFGINIYKYLTVNFMLFSVQNGSSLFVEYSC